MSRPDARFRINVTIDDVRAFFFFFFWSPLQTVWRKEKKINRERKRGPLFSLIFKCGVRYHLCRTTGWISKEKFRPRNTDLIPSSATGQLETKRCDWWPLNCKSYDPLPTQQTVFIFSPSWKQMDEICCCCSLISSSNGLPPCNRFQILFFQKAHWIWGNCKFFFWTTHEFYFGMFVVCKKNSRIPRMWRSQSAKWYQIKAAVCLVSKNGM